TTPMLCARWLRVDSERDAKQKAHGWFYRASENFFARVLRGYENSLSWALGHEKFILFTLLLTVCFNVYLFTLVPKGFIPQQDTGRLRVFIQGEQTLSSQALRQKLEEMTAIIRADPAVRNVMESTGGSGGGHGVSGDMFVTLTPKSERK